jgi:hypothetical protein
MPNLKGFLKSASNLVKRCLFWREIRDWSNRAAFAAILTLLVAIAGGYASLYSSEIKNAFPFLIPNQPWRIIPEAVFWWSLLFAAAYLYLAKQSKDNENQTRLVDRAAKLERLIRTMPPEHFLESFAGAFRQCETAAKAASGPDTSREDIEFGIRSVLRLVASLARTFDGEHSDGRYAANIMLFFRTSNLNAVEKASVDGRLKFCEEGAKCDGLAGVLDLQTALSATAGDDANADADLRKLALPVPVNTGGNRYGQRRILPGAPFAFVERGTSYFGDITLLNKWCLDNGDFTLGVREAIAAHFADRPNLKSFVSIVLNDENFYLSQEENPVEEPIGVVNIHSDRQWMLRQTGGETPGAILQFASLITPFMVAIAKLLRAREQATAGTRDASISEKSRNV